MSILLIAFANTNTFLDLYFWYRLVGGAAIPASLGWVRTIPSITVTTAAKFRVLHNHKRQLPVLGVGLGLRSGDESRGYRNLPAGGGLSLKMLLWQDPISHLGDLPGRKMLNIPTNRFGTFWGVRWVR